MFYIYLGNELMYEPSIEELAVFNPKVTLEMGKAGSLEFDIPQSNPYYRSINQLTSLVIVRMDDDEIFRGRVLSNERAFNNVRSVYCEGDLAFLVDSVQKTEKYSGTTRALFSKFIAAHNARVEASKQFTVGDVTIEDRSIILTGQEDVNVGNIDYKQIAINSIVDDWNTTFDEIQTCLIDYVGGYLRTRYQNGVNYIDYVQEYGGESSQEIELGENLLDLTEEISAEELFTVLVPLGDDNITIKSVNGGSDELVDSEAVAKYGRIVKTHVFSNVNSASTLLENARRYLASNVNVPRTVTITAVDLHMLNKAIRPIRLGDRVHISSTPHGMDEYLTCTKIEYDLANPASNKYTFGNPKQSLTERYKEDKRKENDTYGNSASGGHGGGGGAAADAAEAAADAATEEAEEETKRQIGKFYETYIDLDAEDDGVISLKVLKEYFTGARDILLNEVGIDLSGETGNLNLYSLKNGIDSNGNAIATQRADFNIFQEDMAVALQTTTDYIDTVDGKHEEYHTALIQRSASNEAAITAEVRRAEGAEASLSLQVNNNNDSIISLHADIIDLDGVVRANHAEFQDVISGRTTIGLLKANTIDTSVLEVDRTASINSLSINSGTLGGQNIVNTVHSHYIQAATDGTVTIGNAKLDGNGSFNMADTTFYKNGVSAAKASITIDSIDKYGALDYSESFKRYNVPVIATASNGNTGTTTIVVSATKAFDHGVGSVSISSLGAAWSGYTLSATAKASNGASMSNSWNADWIYDEGYSSGSSDGYTSGYREGYQRGYGDGYAKGADDNKPSGNKWITSNGTHDVAGYATVTVRVI